MLEASVNSCPATVSQGTVLQIRVRFDFSDNRSFPYFLPKLPKLRRFELRTFCITKIKRAILVHKLLGRTGRRWRYTRNHANTEPVIPTITAWQQLTEDQWITASLETIVSSQPTFLPLHYYSFARKPEQANVWHGLSNSLLFLGPCNWLILCSCALAVRQNFI